MPSSQPWPTNCATPWPGSATRWRSSTGPNRGHRPATVPWRRRDPPDAGRGAPARQCPPLHRAGWGGGGSPYGIVLVLVVVLVLGCSAGSEHEDDDEDDGRGDAHRRGDGAGYGARDPRRAPS